VLKTLVTYKILLKTLHVSASIGHPKGFKLFDKRIHRFTGAQANNKEQGTQKTKGLESHEKLTITAILLSNNFNILEWPIEAETCSVFKRIL
jgi:hypothetical protein